MVDKKLRDDLFDLLFWSCACEFIDLFAIDIKPDIRNALHALLCGKTFCLIYIDDAEFYGIGVFISYAVQYRFELFARRAPCCREIDDVDRAGSGNEGVKILRRQVVCRRRARGFLRARTQHSKREK